MNEEETPVKRGPGRPRKDAPTLRPISYKLKAKPNWDEDDVGGLEDESPDRLGINPDIMPDGWSFQWVTDSVYGQPVPQHRARFEKRGWTPCHQEDFDAVFDGMFMPRGVDGEIKVDGMVLMYRPEEITRKARLSERRRAQEVIRIKEQSLRGGDLNTSLDSQHPSALQTNRINRTMERIHVPDERD